MRPRWAPRAVACLRSALVVGALPLCVAAACAPPVLTGPGNVGAPGAQGPDTPAAETGDVTRAFAGPRVVTIPSPQGLPDSALSGFRFVLDAGHGGGERGAPSPIGGHSPEADLNLVGTLLLGGLLEASGADVVYTRKADHAVRNGSDLASDLRERAGAGNQRLADLFVSIHHNGSTDSAFNRVEIYPKLRSAGSSYAAAARIRDELGRLYPDFESRSVAGNFAVLRSLEGEGVLVECAYLSDRRLAPRLETIALAKSQAEAIYRALREWARSAPPAILLVVETGVARVRARTARPGRGGLAWEAAEAVAWSGGSRVAVGDTAGVRIREGVLEWTFSLPAADSIEVVCRDALGGTLGARWLAPALRLPAPSPPLAIVLQGLSGLDETVATALGVAPETPVPVIAWDSGDPSRTLLAVEDLAPRRLVVVSALPARNGVAADPGAGLPPAVPEVVHYFRSGTGRAWAEAVAPRIGAARIVAGSHYLLNHTSMPALWVRMPRPPGLAVPAP